VSTVTGEGQHAVSAIQWSLRQPRSCARFKTAIRNRGAMVASSRANCRRDRTGRPCLATRVPTISTNNAPSVARSGAVAATNRTTAKAVVRPASAAGNRDRGALWRCEITIA
jgi:hypothetical protein